MNVIYKLSMMDKIRSAQNSALIKGKEIERIELTTGESRELNEELSTLNLYGPARSIGQRFVEGDKVFGLNIIST